MLDPPLDTWYVWLGLCAVSVTVAGLALAVPTAPPPSADPVADTVDSVAASPHEARTTVDLSASEIRIRPRGVGLRSDGGSAHARFAYGPVTPVRGGKLARVLDGAHPETVFDTRAVFRETLESARAAEPRWRRAPDRLTVVNVQWGEVDATLVG